MPEEADTGTFLGRWPEPPDLQKFSEPFGGLGAITPERWAEWEAVNKRWREEVERHEAALRAL